MGGDFVLWLFASTTLQYQVNLVCHLVLCHDYKFFSDCLQNYCLGTVSSRSEVKK